MALDKIQAQGFTILHPAQGETSNGSPVADIILVHGLQGHPKRTWLYTSRTQDQRRDSSSRKRWKGALAELMSPKSGSSASVGNAGPSVASSSVDDGVYWPGELLPPDCPNARIMVWGYDTVISKGYAPTDKSSLFGHAKNLLYALNRIRPQDRKIVFVAHSLGGLIVKEMLRRSQADEDSHIQNIIQSTAAVIFLGTPHRGSHEFARLGDMVRKVASTILRVDSNETIIRALGLDSPELELSRESFLQQWRTYGFLVKTFQESQALSGANLGLLNGKIVPDTSSLLDDPREHAEVIHADHRNMTKFSGRDDPNYLKVLGEIQRGINSASVKSNLNISEEEKKECLGSLYYEAMFSRQRMIKNAIPKTCEWFYHSSVFQTWYSRKRASTDRGLLWLKGKPGAGKSTVMKYALAQLECLEGSRSNVASFYFNARGNAMEKSPLGLLRSVLHQLCLQDCQILATFSQTYQRRQSCDGGSYLPWSELELESFFEKAFKESSTRRTFIFIDALDECSEESVREAVYFIDRLAQTALEGEVLLNICLSSRHYPAIRIPNCPEVVVEAHNDSDISTYIRDKLRFIPASERNEAHAIQAFLEEMASGVFLWVVLVVELVVRDINSGQPMSKVAKRVKGVPKDMEDLYHQLFRSLTPDELTFSVPLIQWVLLHKDYLPRTGNGHSSDAPPKIPRTRADGGIRFLHLAVRLSSISGAPTRQNLSDWGYIHPAAPPPTDRILRLINSTSRGLIEYNADGRVQFVHETVREFFLTGPGFGLLDSSLQQNPLGRGYVALVTGCLNALDLPEHSELTTTVKIIHLHTLWALDDYFRGVEMYQAWNPRLLDRLQHPQSNAWRRMRKNEETVLGYMIRNRLATGVLALLERGVHPDDVGGAPSPTGGLITAFDRSAAHDSLLLDELLQSGAELERQNETVDGGCLATLERDGVEMIDRLVVHLVKSYGDGALQTTIDNLKTMKEFWPYYDALLMKLTARAAEINAFPTQHTTLFRDPKTHRDSAGHCDHGGYPQACVDGPQGLAESSLDEVLETVCSHLLRHGADPNLRDKDQRTPLHHAVMNLCPRAAARIIAGGVDVNAVGSNGWNALHYAAFYFSRGDQDAQLSGKMAKLLTNSGCSRNTLNNDNKTPMDLAISIPRVYGFPPVQPWHGPNWLSEEELRLLFGDPNNNPRSA